MTQRRALLIVELTKEGEGTSGEGAAVSSAADGAAQGVHFAQLHAATMNRALYEKTMSESAEATENNVRVKPTASGRSEVQQIRNRLLLGAEYGESEEEEEERGFHLPTMRELIANYTQREEKMQDFIVDRNTIKKLSSLIVNREKAEIARQTRRKYREEYDYDSDSDS